MPRITSTSNRGLARIGLKRFSTIITYLISPDTTLVNEGSAVTFTVSTTNVADGTTLYWTTQAISGSVNASDFTDSATSGSIVINNDTATIIRTLTNDATTEGTEVFRLALRTGSTGGTIVALSADISIGDTSTTPGGVWTNGGNMSVARNFVIGAGSSQSSAIVFHGADASGNFLTGAEQYNGTAWSSIASTNTTRRLGHGVGTATGAISIAGNTSSGDVATTEEYNGTAWSAGPNLNAVRYSGQAFGLRTAAVIVGGWRAQVVVTQISETYNGITWNNTALSSVARSQGAGAGRATDGLVSCGRDYTFNSSGPRTESTEQYNGTAWSTGGNSSLSRENISATVSSSGAASALMAGGQPGPSRLTEFYNESSVWTTTNNLNTARDNLGLVGDNTTALAFGGRTFTITASTERYS